MAQNNLKEGIILREYKDEPLTIEEMDMNLKKLIFGITAMGLVGARNVGNAISLMPQAPTITEVRRVLNKNATVADLKSSIPTYFELDDNEYIFIVLADRNDTEGIISYIDEQNVAIEDVFTFYDNLSFSVGEIDNDQACPILILYIISDKQSSNADK